MIDKPLGILMLIIALWLPASAQSPTIYYPDGSELILIQENTLRAISGPLVGVEVEIWQIAQEHGVDYDLMYDLAFCESSLVHEDQWGDYSSSTDSYLAYGLYQWHQDSWDDYNVWLEVDLDRDDMIDQIEMTALVIKSEGQHNWKNCWRKITKVAYDNN